MALTWSTAVAAGWNDLPPLGQALGGQSAGVSHRALLVVGGSRFDRPPYAGGTKEWVDTLQVLLAGATAWRSFALGTPRAYACAVSSGEAVYVVGGSNARGHLADGVRIEWDGRAPRVEALPALPRPLAQHACAVRGSRLYVLGGQSRPDETTASARLLELDLQAPGTGWRELVALPAEGRIFPVFAALGDSLYAFGGAEVLPGAGGTPARRYLKDGWQYRPGAGWSAAAALPSPRVAAPAAVLSDTTLAVFGGDDGALAGRAAELGERHPGFARDSFLFDAVKNAWSEGVPLPVGLVTTAAVRWRDQIVIVGGEDRPGHRSARVPAIPVDALRARKTP